VLKALYEQRPGFTPVAVSGISIGAVTAAVLAGAKNGDVLGTLDRLWRQELTVSPPVWVPPMVDKSWSILGNPGMYSPQPELFTAPFAATSLYDTAPLRQTLRELIDPVRLNSGTPQVQVGATRVDTGEMTVFSSGHGQLLTFEHIVASCSLPPSFPMTTIGDASYWDGALFSNTPLSPAINALEAAADRDPDAIRELIVVELFPSNAPIPTTLPEVVQRVTHLQYTSRLNLDASFFQKIDAVVDLVDKIRRQLPADSEILRDPEFIEMQNHRRINHFNVVTSGLSPELSNAADFSRASIACRIKAGYQDAIAQGIGSPDSPGLRAGTRR
jgi:predicted acylesterase/phospholipase RssA